MFLDGYAPDFLRRYDFVSVPRWSTNIGSVANGFEQRNQNWQHPLHRFTAPGAIDCHFKLMDLHKMWMACRGPLHSFPLRDPFDFASQETASGDQVPTITRLDQSIGTGNGQRRSFDLVKRYEFAGEVYTRPILLPVVDSVLVGINGIDPMDIPISQGGPNAWTVSRRGGVITFDRAPPAGAVITAGFLFDVEARFESDDAFDIIAKSFGASGTSDVVFYEVRPCAAGG